MMKRNLLIALLSILSFGTSAGVWAAPTTRAASPTSSASAAANPGKAQKSIYIPLEWRNQGANKLYAEQDPRNEYTWSKSRSIENDDIIIYWDKGYGDTKPSDLRKDDFFYVDLEDLLNKCQQFYNLYYNKLGFVNPATTSLNKYKTIVCLCHTRDWTCFGAGYDFVVNALWLNPATCKPVGFSVAHEVGHAFHYMCYADASGNNPVSSSTIGTGFHLPVGKGATIWEQTAQWQACQCYPASMFDESINAFRSTHTLAFTHEIHRYQSYWFLFYLCQHYNDIRTVADVWNQPMNGAVDFNQSLMALKKLKSADLYKLYFDYALRCVTWDFDACSPYRDKYIGDFQYNCALAGDGSYQVAMRSCPQSTGFNVIPLEVPEAGTPVTVRFTALPAGSPLAESDPGQYMKGINDYATLPAGERHYNNKVNPRFRGFRLGFVALLKDGTRKYFQQDNVVCTGKKESTEEATMTVPDNTAKLWFVVVPAPTVYYQHQWNDEPADDDQWPYRFSIDGTTLGDAANVYVNPTLDGREISNTTITYDLTFPATSASSGDYSGCTVTLSGQAAAALGTAFQLLPADIGGRMTAWAKGGPATGKIMFYAVNPNGRLNDAGSTANGYGHWYDIHGFRCGFYDGNARVFSEFNANALTFSIGQKPGTCRLGDKYTIRQALRYRDNHNKEAVATFVFHVTLGTEKSVKVSTGISKPASVPVTPAPYIYTLGGQRITAKSVEQLPAGVYIVNGRKCVSRGRR